MAYDFIKLDADRINRRAEATLRKPNGIPTLQAVIYAMAGGGHLATTAVRQPHEFYIDDRVSGRPYPKRAIMQAVAILARAVELAGMQDSDLQDVDIVNLGVF